MKTPNFGWFLTNTLTGQILFELPVSDDEVYLDINNGEEATITFPAYALSSTIRPQWTSLFKTWTHSLIYVNKDLAYNSSAKIIFSGPIVKRSLDGESELITLTAYGFFEYLKKLKVVPIWDTVNHPAHEITFEANSWSGVFQAIKSSAFSVTGAPANWRVPSTLPTWATVTGTGFSVTTQTLDRESVAEIFERIRDEVSTEGVEFKFRPFFTNSGMTTVYYQLFIGSSATPKFNMATDLTVPLYENDNTWKATSYSFADDGTLTYNKMTLDTGVESTAHLYYSFNDADATMPALEEKFSDGKGLTKAQADAYLLLRTKNSLVTEKTMSLNIAKDSSLTWISFLGKRVIIEAGEKTAGAGGVARVVGLRWSSVDLETNLQVDLMRIADRYPKLPKQIEDESIGGTDNYYDGVINSPTGIPFGGVQDVAGISVNPDGTMTGGTTFVPSDMPSMGDPSLGGDLEALVNQTTFSYGFDTNNTSKPTSSGWVYAIKNNFTSTPNISYNHLTDILPDIIIKGNKVTVNETTYANPTLTVGTAFTAATMGTTLLNHANYALPASQTVRVGVTTGAETSQTITPASIPDYYGKNWVITNLYATDTKLYVWITKRRIYGNYTSQNYDTAYKQIPIIYTINNTTGALENPIFGSPFGEGIVPLVNQEVVILPALVHTSGSQIIYTQDSVNLVSNKSNFMNTILYANRYYATFDGVVVPDNNVLNTKFITAGVTENNIMGDIPEIEIDFTAPNYPIYKKSGIPSYMKQKTAGPNASTKYYNSGNSTTTKTYNIWEKNVSTRFSGEFRNYGGTNEYLYGRYDYDSTTGKMSATTAIYNPYTTFANLFTDSTSFINDYTNTIYVYDKSKNSWKNIGKTYASKTTDYGTTFNPPQLFHMNKNIFIDGPSSNRNPKPKTETVKLKDDKWVYRRENLNSNSIPFGGNGNFRNYFKDSKGNDLVISQSYNQSSLYLSYPTPNPYIRKGKHVSSNCITDTDGRLWTWGVSATAAGYSPVYQEQTIPMLNPTTKTWNGTTGDYQTRLAVDTDGYLWSWGEGNNYVLGTGTTTDLTTPTQIGTNKWKRVIFNTSSVVGLDMDGYLWSWGSNTAGKTAQGTTSGFTLTPTKIGTKKWIEFDYNGVLIAVDENRDIYSAGTMTGQQTTNTLVQVASTASKKWSKAYSGVDHFIAISIDDTIWSWGNNASGKTGLATVTGSTTVPTQVISLDNTLDTYTKLVLTANNSYGLATDGKLWSWGAFALNGLEESTLYSIPKQMTTHDPDPQNEWTNIYSMNISFAAIHKDGTIWSPATNGGQGGGWTPTTKAIRPLFGGNIDSVGTEGETAATGSGGGGGVGWFDWVKNALKGIPILNF